MVSYIYILRWFYLLEVIYIKNKWNKYLDWNMIIPNKIYSILHNV